MVRRVLHCSQTVRRTILVTAVVAVIASQPSPTMADVAGSVTMGAALQAAFNKAGDLIRQARETGNDLLLGIGVEIQNAITSARIAYESSLTKTIDQMNDQERKVVTDFDHIIETAINKGAKEAHELLIQAQILVDIVPFHNKIPLVGGYTPHFIPPVRDIYSIEVSGNFPFGFSKTDAPILTVGGTTLKPVSYGTTWICFNVPKQLLGAIPPNTVTSCPMTLDVPWDASRWYNLFGTKVNHGVFRLEFAVLPGGPGHLTITHKVPGTPHHEEAEYRSEVFNFDSSNDDIEENRSLHLSEDTIRNGWRIVPHSVGFEMVQHVEGVEGHDWYNMGYQGGSDVEAIWRVRTERKHVGSSGKILWRISCRIARDMPTSTDVPEDVALTWDMSRIFAYPAGAWKITWTRFDGAVQEYSSTNLDSLFLKVDATGDSFRIVTYSESLPIGCPR